jgi:hypothetical protein
MSRNTSMSKDVHVQTENLLTLTLIGSMATKFISPNGKYGVIWFRKVFRLSKAASLAYRVTHVNQSFSLTTKKPTCPSLISAPYTSLASSTTLNTNSNG